MHVMLLLYKKQFQQIAVNKMLNICFALSFSLYSLSIITKA